MHFNYKVLSDIYYRGAFIVLAFYFFFLFLGSSITVMLFRQLRWQKALVASLRENDVHTVGSIVVRRQKGPLVTDITFTYEVEGKNYTQIYHASGHLCSTISIADPVVVLYNQQEPDISTLKDIDIVFEVARPALVLFLATLTFGVGVGFSILLSFILLLFAH